MRALVMAIALVLAPVLATAETFKEEFSRPHTPTIAYSASSPDSWTGWNRFWFATAIGGQAADAATTIHGLKGSCKEVNPILGSDPSSGTIIVFKLGVIGLAWLVTEKLVSEDSRQNTRNWVYGALGVTGIGAAIWNSNQNCN